MALKQCEKCSEMVDEAKAFCPGCGHAFVEETKRSEESKFSKMDSTVQLGQTMYNQMLSDMGLNAANTPKPAEKVSTPAVEHHPPPTPEKRIEVIAPVATAPKPSPAAKPTEQPKPVSSKKWLILAGVLTLLFLLALLVIGSGVFIYWTRFR